MKTIIVPTDFTEVSSNAARYALELAKELKASVTLFHVYPVPLAFSEIPIPPDLFDILREDAEQLLEKAKEDLAQVAPQGIEIYTGSRPGTFLTALGDFCDETAPEAVVMSSHGHEGLEKLLLGSETNTTIKHLKWPVLIVPREAKFKVPKNIALACDFLDVKSTIPADAIRTLVNRFKTKLFVLHIHPDAKEPYSAEVMDGTSDLQEMLTDLHPSYFFVDSKNVIDSILVFIEKNEIDLLITFPKSRTLLEGLLHKSRSGALARETPIPLLAFHEK